MFSNDRIFALAFRFGFFQARRAVIKASRRIPGVYVITDPTGIAIDVGQAETVGARLSKHDRRKCWERYNTLWWPVVLRVDDKNDRDVLERTLRRILRPLCGKR